MADPAAAPGFQVRQLGQEDFAPMRELLRVFGDALEDVERYTGEQPDDAYLARLLAGETFIALVAIVDGAVVGGLATYVLPKFEQARCELYIYDLAVHEAHRRRGIATALIEALRGVATATGAYVVFVQANCEDEPAVALYTKLGARQDVYHFDIAPS